MHLEEGGRIVHFPGRGSAGCNLKYVQGRGDSSLIIEKGTVSGTRDLFSLISRGGKLLFLIRRKGEALGSVHHSYQGRGKRGSLLPHEQGRKAWIGANAFFTRGRRSPGEESSPWQSALH